MPGFTYDGELYMDTKKMLLAFDAAYKDSTLTPEQQARVTELVTLNYQYQDSLMELVMYFAWWGFHHRMQDVPKDRFEAAYGPSRRFECKQVPGRILVRAVSNVSRKFVHNYVKVYQE